MVGKDSFAAVALLLCYLASDLSRIACATAFFSRIPLAQIHPHHMIQSGSATTAPAHRFTGRNTIIVQSLPRRSRHSSSLPRSGIFQRSIHSIRTWLYTLILAHLRSSNSTDLHQKKSVSELVEDGQTLEEVTIVNSTALSPVMIPQQKFPTTQRWAVAANTTDLSGTWKPIITPTFRQEYDNYLIHCGEGILFRRAMMGAIGFSREVIEQLDGGRELAITGTTPIGSWKRILIASGHSPNEDSRESLFEPVFSSFQDPDGDRVTVESWWEDEGHKHKSWLRGKPRVLGGVFETTRYLENGSNSLICESIFHPPPGHDDRFEEARVEWKFERSKNQI